MAVIHKVTGKREGGRDVTVFLATHYHCKRNPFEFLTSPILFGLVLQYFQGCKIYSTHITFVVSVLIRINKQNKQN